MDFGEEKAYETRDLKSRKMMVPKIVSCVAMFYLLAGDVDGEAYIQDKFIYIKNSTLNNSTALASHEVSSVLGCALLCSRSRNCPAACASDTNTTRAAVICEFHAISTDQKLTPLHKNRVLLKIEENVCLVTKPCLNGGSCTFLGSTDYSCVCPEYCSGTRCESCCVIGSLHGEVHTITIGSHTRNVFIEAGLAGDNWIVLMRQRSTTLDFARNWNEFKAGFGDPTGNFWIGNEFMHQLTNNGSSFTLRVDLKFVTGECKYAEYSVFRVASEGDKYRLTVQSYRGDAGDAFKIHDNRRFSTYDSDNDGLVGRSCTTTYKRAGWWYHACYKAKLSGDLSWLGEKLEYGDMKIHIH